jgi:HEAT repeat protein
MTGAAETTELVSRLPDPNQQGTYADLDENKVKVIEEVVDRLERAGADAVSALAAMLVEPGKGDDTKPRFALHLLAVRVTQLGRQQSRQSYCEALAAELTGDRPAAVKEFLIERLQLAGTRAVAGALGRMLLEPQLCDAAARALAAIGDGAAEQFLAALPKLNGPSRRCVIGKLAMLRAKEAAPVFQQALDDPDEQTRIAAAWGLSRLGLAEAAEKLLRSAEARSGWERIQQTDACMCLAETLAASGKKSEAAAIYRHLAKTRSDPSEMHIRAAAERALVGLK